MSRKSKGTTIEKTVETFKKLGLDEQIKAFNEIKLALRERIETEQHNYASKANELNNLAENL